MDRSVSSGQGEDSVSSTMVRGGGLCRGWVWGDDTAPRG